MEYWDEATLQRLLSLAGEFVMVDDCMAERKRIGFIRVCAKVAFSWPLRLDV